MTDFTKAVIDTIKSIPKGKVSSYGDIARRAGNPRGARAVVFILKSRSHKDQLAWHRIVGKGGQIRISNREWFQVQKKLLEDEGVEVSESGKINMEKYGWM